MNHERNGQVRCDEKCDFILALTTVLELVTLLYYCVYEGEISYSLYATLYLQINNV